ncbi:MAG TPA: DNA internalization-related competence protein ComEC/Rec2 [Steroidobacteraceae bacterium]
MLRIGLAVLIGQCCIHSLPTLPAPSVAVPVLAAACIAAAALRRSWLVAFVLSAGWALLHAELQLREDLPVELEGRDLLVVGRVASLVELEGTNPRFDFQVEHASEAEVPSRINVVWYEAEVHPRPGERWQLVVRLKRRNGFANPGGFDYEGYLFRAGIGATGYVRAGDDNAKLDEPTWRYGVLCARAWLGERIARSVPSSPMLGILQGLAIGDAQLIPQDQWRVFNATGTSHLMAISGLHVSMVAALAAVLGGAIVRLPRMQRYRMTAIHGQAVAGIGAALGYSLLAGMSVPTQRTLAMICIYFLARWSRRHVSLGNALGLALIAVLLIDPFAVLSVGTWLSFGAVAVIVLATGGRMRKDGVFANFARVQWAATAGLLPIVVMAFGGLSLISPIANAIAIPLFTLVVVPLTLIGTATACAVPEVGSVLLGGAAKLLEWAWPFLSWLAARPLAMWYFPDLPLLQAALLASGALLLVLPGAWPMRIAALALCLPAVLYYPEPPARGAYELAVLDVGQGLAIVVRTHRHTLVYDAGPAFRSGRDTGELVVWPYLRARGIRRVDRLVISHGDLDHQGGMRSILDNMKTLSLSLGPSVNSAGIDAERCAAGQRWQWDEVEFEVLHPDASNAYTDNDSSCVLLVKGRGGTALLTGDIEAAAEAEVLARGLGRIDVLVIPHHGSRSSSTDDFVEKTSPRLALVSAGYRNRWGFPRREVVERWQSVGATIASTVESGAIEVSVPTHGQIAVRHHRREHPRYWASR